MAIGNDRDGAPQRWIYGRQRGKRLRAGRQMQMATLLPKLRIDPAALSRGGFDPRDLFARSPREVWLEVGFGAGEHLARQAAAHRDVGFIGCEPYLAGVARLLGYVEEWRLDNVRLLVDDARLLLHALPDRSIARSFLLFPDPWPKRRHHKRRFVSHANLVQMARLLSDGAEWRIATDDQSYCRWMLAHLTADAQFSWLANGPEDWRSRTDDWPATRYEEKALAGGRRCVYLRFKRQPHENEGCMKELAGEGQLTNIGTDCVA